MNGVAHARECRKRKLTTRSGVVLPFTELGLAGAPLGNLHWPLTEKEARATLDAAWTAGCRYYDTAPRYGLGLSETRINGFLRAKPRDSYLLSTKVGRRLELCASAERSLQGSYFETPSRREAFDYSYDGVMRALEASFERLGLDRVDIVYAHDVDAGADATKEDAEMRMRAFMEGGYKALLALRAAGVIRAIGAEIKDCGRAETLARWGDFDLFLLAGRYTLLEQEALTRLLPLCAERKIGVVVGGPFNSGILAKGPKRGAIYNYTPASEAVLERVRRIQTICTAHRVKLAEAALRLPLSHPVVVSVIPGAHKAGDVRRNADMLNAKIPPALWRALKAEGLLRADAPTPR